MADHIVLGAFRIQFSFVFLLSFTTLVVLGDVPGTAETSVEGKARIDREAIVRRFNPVRRHSSPLGQGGEGEVTPLQIGNGDFAFNTDITSLQTIHPFNILSSWGWKEDAYPVGRTKEDIEQYQGATWPNQHGMQVPYDFGGPPDLEAYLRGSPNRANLGRIGLVVLDGDGSSTSQDGDEPTANGDVKPIEIRPENIHNATQTLDLWSGILTSRFELFGEDVVVRAAVDMGSDTVGISVESKLLLQGSGKGRKRRLGLFIDFPWNEGREKFAAPFVGYWNETEKHITSLSFVSGGSSSGEEDEDGKVTGGGGRKVARITHREYQTTSYAYISGSFDITRDSPYKHRYTILPSSARSTTLSLSVHFSPNALLNASSIPSSQRIFTSSRDGWRKYWEESGFIDVLTGSTDPRAEELQRRIILSRYLMRVNAAGETPPQESGLVNNGWFGKFHMGWKTGARWPKMTDPSGRSSPGELNNLLIWQQPHPLVFAQYELRSVQSPLSALTTDERTRKEREVLEKWRPVVKETADWMAEFAWFNETKGTYNLAPPIHVVSEDTNPNRTYNPAFELAYWRLGLGLAEEWFERLGEEDASRSRWREVRENLAHLPFDKERGLYQIYEGIESDFWMDEKYTSDHPALVGLYGWLPPTDGLDTVIARKTAEEVWKRWNITNCWGWDFPMLAMSAARQGNQAKAVEWLLHPLFAFADAGMPIGGARVPTPYFPGSGGLLYAVAMMAEGWDGFELDEGRAVGREGMDYRQAPGFPEGWDVRTEGIDRAL
ncbi:hypothetical protein CC1G_09604 [Coprinopsis cinerea okayama7|uniref:Uncharacterized protein n=1 Tax=Coprinopsis cinerea (strain Okayama-7 / 130 / ATCC MYA-4618 / FGSC 9003) TaxID=240176 RepID=A8N4C0_COPC7|nr:hypothetical protein CC1G_09604 [Coprinopsis cinerea okayama7\|eukprot:XP_001829715.1 hypothetical protein CC1G_09604 [Coprinopsis cinerea okayama7\